jgi:hypothetical protein
VPLEALGRVLLPLILELVAHEECGGQVLDMKVSTALQGKVVEDADLRSTERTPSPRTRHCRQ